MENENEFETLPVIVEAHQWTGENDHELLAFGTGKISITVEAANIDVRYLILQKNNVFPPIIEEVGAWAVKDLFGEFFLYPDEEFVQLFKRRGYFPQSPDALKYTQQNFHE